MTHSTRLLPFLFVAVSSAANAQCLPHWSSTFPYPGTGSPTSTLTAFDDGSGPALIVGGTFGMAGGIPATHIARWDGENWSALQGGTNAFIRATIAFDDGSGPAVYVGGEFTQIGGVAASFVARWNGATWSSVGAGLPNGVHAFALFDDGAGTKLCAATRPLGAGTPSTVLRWDGATWTALGGTFDGIVHALASFDDGAGTRLFAAGSFSTASGAAASNIAAWDGASWSSVGGGVDEQVEALAPFDDGSGPALYAGGFFATAGGTPARAIARWNGAAWSAVGNGAISGAGVVFSLATFDDGSGPALIAGGGFSEIGGTSASGIARWDGTAWSSLGSGVDIGGLVDGLGTFDDGSGVALYVVGEFVHAGGVLADRIARWDGASWSSLGHGLDNDVNALATYDLGAGEALFAAGHFRFAGGIPAAGIARWDGGAWSALGSGFPFNGVNALVGFDDGSGRALYAGGEFSSAGGVVARRVARWNGSAWSEVGGGVTGADQRVSALAVFDAGGGAELYAAGSFTHAGGVAAASIARWNGTSWSALASGIGGRVSALAVVDDGSGPALYVGGFFSSADGIAANGLARWDGTSWSVLPGPGLGLNVLAAFDDGAGPKLYAGGIFTTIGGVSASNVARWDGASWSALGSGVNSAVDALCVFDDGSGAALYVGGAFTLAGGVAANHVARWDGASWSTLDGGVAGLTPSGVSVRALAAFDDQSDGASDLYLGGRFTSAGGLGASRIAQWHGCAQVGVAYCFGEGAIPCPCANAGAPGHGCANSVFASGGLLAASGTASVGADTIVLTSSALSGNTSLYFQGTAQGVAPIDDGLLCLSGTLLRIGLKPVAGGVSVNPSGVDLPISVKGALPVAGGTRFYQTVYRNAVPFCTPATTNRTNGVSIVWQP